MVNDARLSGHVHLATLQDVLARNRYPPARSSSETFTGDQNNPTRSDFDDDFKALAHKRPLRRRPRPEAQRLQEILDRA